MQMKNVGPNSFYVTLQYLKQLTIYISEEVQGGVKRKLEHSYSYNQNNL